MKTEQAVKMAAKLYECRDAAKNMFGNNYQEQMEAYGQVVKSAANSMGCSELSAATELANKVGGIAAVLYLAAVVEMIEPSNVKVSGPEAALSPEGRARLPGCAPDHNGE